MTKKEFGEITRIIREEILKLSQEELAEKIKSKQSLVSRMERGLGNIDQLLSLLSYYRSEGLKPHMIFNEPFQKEALFSTDATSNVDQVIHVVQQIKDDFSADMNKLLLLINTLE